MQPTVKCLIVDDLEENLLALAALLRRDDVELLTARSGAQALDLLLSHEVALAILDVHMPEMDGFELAELMRGSARTRHVPILFVTAAARDEHRLFKGYDAGAVDFLYKPIEPRILLNKAETFFQLYRQRLELAQELKRRTDTLRLYEMFTAVLGHDLRNPLNAIVTSAHLLKTRPPDGIGQEAVQRILASGKRMSRMIEDLIDVSRARLAGGFSLKPEPVDLLTLLQRVVKEHQAAHPDRRLEVHHQGDLLGVWDAGRLAQVASNLIGNALQHGERDLPIEVELDGTHADVVTMAVTNSGSIRPEILPHLFEPFRGGQRVPGQSDRLGLGLYIVEQIVSAHHGTVAVQSAQENRTRFNVTIPRDSADR